MTEVRERKRPLRVPVGPLSADDEPLYVDVPAPSYKARAVVLSVYRRGDRLIDPSRTLWRVDAVDGETVRLETVGGGLRLDLEADALRDWERVWG